METIPDRWKVIKISSAGETFYKVLAGWVGGFAGSDSWRFSSPIQSVSIDENKIAFSNESGSRYLCNPRSEGFTVLSRSIFQSFLEDAKKLEDVEIEQINFCNLPKELYK